MSELDVNGVLSAMNPQLYQQFKRAIEIKKWANGQVLTQQQLDTCLQAVILYEHHHVSQEQRTGYVPPKAEACETDDHIHTVEKIIKWADSSES